MVDKRTPEERAEAERTQAAYNERERERVKRERMIEGYIIASLHNAGEVIKLHQWLNPNMCDTCGDDPWVDIEQSIGWPTHGHRAGRGYTIGEAAYDAGIDVDAYEEEAKKMLGAE